MDEAGVAPGTSRPVTSVRLLLQLGAERGLDPADLLVEAGVESGVVDVPDAEVSVDQERDVLAALVAALGDEDPVALGWAAGRRYHLTTYGIWGFAIVSSPTVRAAIEVGSRHLALTYALTRIEVELRPETVHVRLDGSHLAGDVRTAAVARDAAAIAVVRDELLGAQRSFVAVRSRAQPPSDPTLGERTFGIPVTHGADVDEVVLPASVLDQPLPRADARTAALAAGQCASLLAERRTRGGVAGEVRDRLLADPSQPPSVADIAAERGVTERTLRRHLAAEGTTFRALHDEVRETLAHELLVVAGLSVEQTARRVGYLETASFVHAFRRWTGTTPGAYRARFRKSPSGVGMRAMRPPQS